ncbi:MAG: acetyl-CoA decarbonylase/synthase complex subunit gamma [Methanoregulaceae archaeon]|nr:acetyl-CoA decarbonylase/synthase complex subunit gamma [Methanoregulaceae archaeon]
MPKKKLGPMNLYPLLPKTNCGECGPKTCMGFAVQLTERNLGIDQCPPIADPKYQVQLSRIRELLAPPVREVVIGTGPRKVRVGGELVMRRHELRYFNQTAIATLVSDDMLPDQVQAKVKETEAFRYPYIGSTLTLDAIAVRSVTGDPASFRNTVKTVREATELPLILWSFDPRVIAAGLEAAAGHRPLIYAANVENWQEMAGLARDAGCPLALFVPDDIRTIRSLAASVRAAGVEDLLLDVGCGFSESLPSTINDLTEIRTAAVNEGDSLLGYPIIGSPATLWEKRNSESDETIRWMESCLASMMVIRYVDLLMVRDASMWSILPLVVLRANLFNDPRKPVSVEPGLRTFGNPDPDRSPVLITSNFALTYYTVLADIEKLDCYLMVADTEGLSVDSAVAGRKLNAQKVADIILSTGIEGLARHRTLIIPGLAARLKGDIEDATGWDVMVGPRDSAGIPAFLKEKWEGKDHTPGWSYR